MIMEINVLNLDSACALTLKLLRAKIEPIYDAFFKRQTLYEKVLLSHT